MQQGYAAVYLQGETKACSLTGLWYYDNTSNATSVLPNTDKAAPRQNALPSPAAVCIAATVGLVSARKHPVDDADT